MPLRRQAVACELLKSAGLGIRMLAMPKDIDGSGRELSRKSLTYGIRLLNEANYQHDQIEHRQKQRLVQEVDPETVPAGPN